MAQLRSYDELVAFLEAQKIPHKVDAANHAVLVATPPPALPGGAIVRWETKIPYLQIIQQITAPVPDERVRELETAISHINDTAMIPGYGFSYAGKVVYYRLSVPIYDGSISSDSLDRAITAVLNNAAQLEPALKKVVEGAAGASVLSYLTRS